MVRWLSEDPSLITGLFLSVMSDQLHHLSVHNGEIIRSLPFKDFRVHWEASEEHWPETLVCDTISIPTHHPEGLSYRRN